MATLQIVDIRTDAVIATYQVPPITTVVVEPGQRVTVMGANAAGLIAADLIADGGDVTIMFADGTVRLEGGAALFEGGAPFEIALGTGETASVIASLDDLLATAAGPELEPVAIGDDGTGSDGSVTLDPLDADHIDLALPDGGDLAPAPEATTAAVARAVTESEDPFLTAPETPPGDEAAPGGLVISGTPDADSLIGGSGADVLRGGGGADVLTGNGGADRFVIDVPVGPDFITDFTLAEDQLALSDLITGYDGDPTNAGDFVVLRDDGAGNTDVLVNGDGSAGGAFTQVAVLEGVTGLGGTLEDLVTDGTVVL